jgi:O-antigen ligase
MPARAEPAPAQVESVPVQPARAYVGALARQAAWVPAMLLPAGVTLYLGLRSGGFFPGATALAAVEMAIALAIWSAVSRQPLAGLSKPLMVAAAAIGCLAAWTLLSSDWSDSTARAMPGYTRVLLYALTLLLFGLLPFNARRIRWMVYGLATAIVAICATAIIARTHPDLILDPTLAEEPRLAYPLTYWNALGILAGVGFVLCAYLATSTRTSPIARVLGAAATPLLALTLLYTLSRGPIWVTVAALIVYVVVGRPRALLTGAAAIAPATIIALATASPTSNLTDLNPTGPAAVTEGEHVFLVLVFCMLGAGFVRALMLPLDTKLSRLRLPYQTRRQLLVGGAISAVVLVLAGAMAVNAPGVASTKYHEFTDRSVSTPDSPEGESRLLSARSNGRLDLWNVAIDAYRSDRLKGTGAGTYELQLAHQRDKLGRVFYAHNLYLEVLGELGLIGLVLLLVALGLILGVFAYRARGADRSLFAALLAVGLAWAVHAGVDWDWQMPAVTLWLFALGGAALARSPLESREDEGRRERSGRIDGRAMLIVRVAGVGACVGLAIIPARIAISQDRLNSAIDGMERGDCQTARAEARSALDAVEQRPTPYRVLSLCDMGQGRFPLAVVHAHQALDRDPNNWQLSYTLAVARASAGLDPSGPARRAATLNPSEQVATSAPARLDRKGRRALQEAGRSAPLLPLTNADP